MSKRLDQLMAAKNKVAQKKHSAQQEEKRIDQQISKLKRDERTHRLCTRGAYLEKLLQEPELFSDEEVFRILDYVFGTPYAKTHLKAALEAKRHGSENAGLETADEGIDDEADVGITGNS